MQGLFEYAPAKINLALHVTGRRADGYHNLESLVVFADVADELRATAAPKDRLFIKGPFAALLSSSQSNLVLRAVSAFRAKWPDAVAEGVELELTKVLPVAAGIGGGSADAAAALRLMQRLSAIPIPNGDLVPLAEKLGADVPMCLASVPCLVRGIGEQQEPLATFPHFHVVLVNPLLPLVTADIFRRLTRADNPGLPRLEAPIANPAMLALWLEETRNDLEGAAIELVPAISEISVTLRKTQGCVAARMSGSGATVFGLYGSGAEAHQAAHDVRARWPEYWVAAAPLTRD